MSDRSPVRLVITLHSSGAMSIEGPIDDKEFCLQVLAQAMDGVRNHHKPRTELVGVPAKDVRLALP